MKLTYITDVITVRVFNSNTSYLSRLNYQLHTPFTRLSHAMIVQVLTANQSIMMVLVIGEVCTDT